MPSEVQRVQKSQQWPMRQAFVLAQVLVWSSQRSECGECLEATWILITNKASRCHRSWTQNDVQTRGRKCVSGKGVQSLHQWGQHRQACGTFLILGRQNHNGVAKSDSPEGKVCLQGSCCQKPISPERGPRAVSRHPRTGTPRRIHGGKFHHLPGGLRRPRVTQTSHLQHRRWDSRRHRSQRHQSHLKLSATRCQSSLNSSPSCWKHEL